MPWPTVPAQSSKNHQESTSTWIVSSQACDLDTCQSSSPSLSFSPMNNKSPKCRVAKRPKENGRNQALSRFLCYSYPLYNWHPCLYLVTPIRRTELRALCLFPSHEIPFRDHVLLCQGNDCTQGWPPSLLLWELLGMLTNAEAGLVGCLLMEREGPFYTSVLLSDQLCHVFG